MDTAKGIAIIALLSLACFLAMALLYKFGAVFPQVFAG